MPAWIGHEVSPEEIQKLEAGESLEYDNSGPLPAYNGQIVQLVLEGRYLTKYCLATKNDDESWKLTLEKFDDR